MEGTLWEEDLIGEFFKPAPARAGAGSSKGFMIVKRRWIPRFFEITGAVILIYCTFVLVRAQAFQFSAKWAFDRMLQNRHASVRPQMNTRALSASSNEDAEPRLDSVVGKIEIPRLHLSTMILEGDEEKELLLGAGHVPGTALPDQEGNVVIAGHRDTFFRPLSKISKNDQIVVTTFAGTFQYIVDAVEITDAGNVAVLQSSSAPSLTMITCYPFNFVGPAPDRFIVHARKIG